MVLRRYDRTERVVDLNDVAELRVAVNRARADPDVVGYRYWRLTEYPGGVRTACPGCGGRYQPGQVHDRICRCGLRHLTYECRSCCTTEVDPPYEDGCGQVPFDVDGVNARYRRWWRLA